MRVGQPEGAERARLAAGVGARIRSERAARGWTQLELRRRSGLDTAHTEVGLRRPSWSGLCRVAAAFCPDDRAAADTLAWELALLAGPSLASDPRLPASVGRELLVAVLARSARVLGFDLDDDRVRMVVVDELRRAAGEQPADGGLLAIGAAGVHRGDGDQDDDGGEVVVP